MPASPPPPPPSKRLSLWRVLGTVLSIALLVYLIATQWEEFAGVLKQVPVGIFLLALGLMLLSRVSVTLRWFVLLRSAGTKIRFLQVLRLTFMGLFASNFLPSTVGGDLVRMVGAVNQRVDPGVSAASLVIDRLVGMAGMTLFLPAGLLAVLQTNGAAQWPGRDVLLGLAGFPFLNRLWERIKQFLRSLLSSAGHWLRHPASLGWALLCTLGHMLFTYLSVSVLLGGMGQPLSFWTIGGLWSISYFFTLVPISVNGLGLQEVSITFLYTRFGGVSTEAALALAVFMRMLFLLASLPGALFLPDILHPAGARPPVAERPAAETEPTTSQRP